MMWTAIFSAMLVYLQLAHRYYFPFIEQQQMFVFDGAYLLGRLARPTGAVSLLAEFCLQFFALPCCGALISAGIITLTGIAAQYVINSLSPRNGVAAAWLFPVAALLFPLLNYDYRLSGTISYLLATVLLAFYIRFALRPGSTRLGRCAFATIAAVALFWAAGPAATLFAACVLAYEAATHPDDSPLAIIPCTAVALTAVWSVYSASLIGELRWALLPDAYYNPMMHPEPAIYSAWIALPFFVFCTALLKDRKQPARWRRITESVAQAAVLVLFLLHMADAEGYYLQPDTVRFQELDYLLRNKRWDDMIDRAGDGATDNRLHRYMLNIALVERDMLTGRAFAFRQNGIEGLSIDWSDNNPFLFPMISDMQYAAGNPSAAQETAFKKLSESLAVSGSCNPRMLMRLVETALVCGGHSGYATAEKYIGLLERSLFYRRWAADRRRFLRDDAAVESDPRLGDERRAMQACEIIYSLDRHPERAAGLTGGRLARRALDHLCMGYLLNADLDGLYRTVSLCAGGELMPELPEYYQEALLIHAAQNRDTPAEYPAVSDAVRKRFLDFQNFAARNYRRSDLASVMRKSYGDTYLYYYMFVSQQ